MTFKQQRRTRQWLVGLALAGVATLGGACGRPSVPEGTLQLWTLQLAPKFNPYMASVIKAVYVDKLALNCACVGGNSNVPLGFVSLTENLVMIGMGLWMPLRLLLG